MSRYPGGIITKSPATPTGPTTTGRAPGVWRMDEVAYWTRQGLWPNANIQAPDTYFPYVSLLLSTTSLGNANNNLFVDSSGAFNPIARNGNTTQGSFTPYGANWSNFFDGAGDWFSVPDSASLQMGSSDFTYECWLYPTAIPNSYQSFIEKRGVGGYAGVLLAIKSNGKYSILVASNSSTWGIVDETSIDVTLNAWQHIAVVRSGSTFSVYKNGVRLINTTISFSVYDNTSIQGIGAGDSSGNQPFYGYISNVRIVKGTAVYTADFTVPTAPLTAISGTSLLTCQSNRFRDASTNNFTITVNGNTSVTEYSPFAPAYPGIVYNQSDITNWSGYFNGGTDRVQVPVTSNMYLGTTYTIEAWAYYNSTSYGARPIFSECEPFQGGFAGLTLTLNTSGNLVAEYRPATSGAVTTITGPTVTPYTWFHIALVSDNSSAKLYVNGTQVGSTTTFGDYPSAKTAFVAVGSWGHGWNDSGIPAAAWIGYISNMRVVKGVAVYTSNFTPSTTPLTAVSGTVLLTCQNAAFSDNSSVNNALTPVSGATVTGNNPFQAGYYSNYFDGSGDYLEVTGANLAMGSGAWTIEGWIYLNAYPGSYAQIYDSRFDSHGSTAGLTLYVGSTGTLRVYQGTDRAYTTGTISLATWTHFAAVFDGSTLRLYINGTNSGTNWSTSLNLTNTTIQIACEWTKSAGFQNAYISNFRNVKGTALYTSNFTPPTAPLTAISGTALLTCQSGRFVDASTNNYTITRNGDTSVQSFDPFYTSTIASNGGSMYFDGSGDYLRGANGPAFQFGTGDFTVEMWAYFMDPAATNRPLFDNGATSNTGRLLIRQGNDVSTANVVNAFVSGTTASSPTIQFYSWTHVAVVRQSGTVKIYINGVGGTGVTATADLSQNACLLGAFYDVLTANFTGYMSNVRVTKGTAVYTANFTPPTAPVTPSANTSLLVNGMNAGAYDATAINNMETVGGAQVTTAVSKYGGSSVFFNGTNSILTTAKKVPCVSGTSNFTIEYWLNPATIKLQTLVSMLTSVSSVDPHTYMDASGYVHYYTAGAQRITGNIQLSANQWYHVAVSRVSGVTRLFINGVQSGSNYSDGNSYVSPAYVNVGQYMSSDGVFYTGEWLSGYIDDLRITPGVGRYSANFTPPTQAFPTY